MTQSDGRSYVGMGDTHTPKKLYEHSLFSFASISFFQLTYSTCAPPNDTYLS